MDQQFACPQCHRTHAEPAEATFVLHVLCLDCALERDYHAQLAAAVLPEVAEAA